ncbi:MAG: sugar porter family MFS transporter [Actinobacteria bacterium]|nr:sugar porter family MFS transporter [Actinomycetota bacterium]
MAQPAPGAGRGTGNSVLSALDGQKSTAFLFRLTLLATLGGFLFGYDTSNIGSALNFVPYNLKGLAEGYLVSGASLGAAAGAIAAGPIADRFGRKGLLIADAGIYALGSILSAITPDAAVLLAARTLIGLAIGADSAIATAYIAEYAPKDKRGSLSLLQQWMITVGILVAYLIAILIFGVWPNSAASVGWRLILGLGAVPALLGLALRTSMPESPRWLLRHGKYDKARDALGILGVHDVSDEDIRSAAQTIESIEGGQSREQRRKNWTPGVRRALIVVCVFFIFQQITGINVPLYYGPHLLGPIFSGAHATLVKTTVAGVEVTAIMTAVNVASTYLGFRWIDKFGRRKLSMGGYAGMIAFALVAAAGLVIVPAGNWRLAVIMIGLDGFIASFAIGVGGTGWTLQGEVFPTAVRGQAAAIAAMFDWLANFLLIEIFPVSQNAISLAGVLVVFAGLCALAIVFIWKFLPETKGLPVEDVIGLFDKAAKQGPLGGAGAAPTPVTT